MSAKAKQARDEWEIKLIACKESLVQVSQATPVVRRTVTKKLTELSSIWAKLQTSHSVYCRHAGVGLGSSESRDYLREVGKLKDEAEGAAETALGEEDPVDLTVRRLKRSISTLQSEVSFTIPTIQSLADENEALSKETYQQVLNLLAGAEDKLGRYAELSAEAEDLLDTVQAEALSKKTSASHTEHGSKLMALRGKIVKKAPKETEAKPIVKDEQGVGEASARVVKKEPVKIKPIDCPTWDGKFRTFARFQKLWKENITPRHEDSALHLMLVQCLPKFVLENISTLTDSADDIWKYLEEKYGKPEVVAREVMSELMGLESRKLGQKFMGKFCTLLLDTHSLLTSMGEEDWLVSNRSVSELESKLPREEQIEWVKQMGTIGGDTKFEKFKNFLQQRKAVLELLDTMGYRPGRTDTRCEYCSRPGHDETDCYTKQREQRSGSRGLGGQGGCHLCGETGHWKDECPGKDKKVGKKTNHSKGKKISGGGAGGKAVGGVGGASGDGAVAVEIGSNTLRPLECMRCRYASKLGSCAGCKKSSSLDHCLLHCPSYNLMSVPDKVNVVKQSKSCAVCLHPAHTTDKCDFKDKEKNICGFGGCKSHHHPSLHGSKDVYVTGVNVLLLQQVQAVSPSCVEVKDWGERQQYIEDSFPVSVNTVKVNKSIREVELDEVRQELCKPLLNGDKVLMTMMYLPVKYGLAGEIAQIVGFFDDGSNCSVVKNSVAIKLGLWGENVTLELGTVNATTTTKTKLYCVELVDIDGGRHLVKAFGLDKLSGPLPTITMNGIKFEFSVEVQNQWDKMARPEGEVDLLIGSEVAHLHPTHMETAGKMVVKQSIFGTGLVLNGGHELLDCGSVEFERSVQIIRSGAFSTNKITVSYRQEVSFGTVEEMQYMQDGKDFMAAEALGCEPPRRCIRCKGCPDCTFRGAKMSAKEAVELRMMEEKMQFDENIGKWRVGYPFLQDPKVLRDNYKTVLRMAETLERRLDKADIVEPANEVFHKMVANGAVVELDQREIDMWDGAVHWLPIQVIINMDSVTTPFRLVTNSSLVDRATGLSLNSILAKGPKVLNDMWDIIIKFRGYECGVTGDITKAYYQIHTGEVEKHVRRILWRDGKVGQPWRIYAFQVVSMGDTPAATFMELTKRATAEMAKEIDRVAAKKIQEDTFSDDLTTGGTEAECNRFKGNEDPVSLACDGTIPRMLGVGGFEVKAMGMSGEPDGAALEKLGGAVFGIPWSTARDEMSVVFRVNISQHKRGTPTGPDLTKETLAQLDGAVLTKRICLRVCSSQYDPVGIATLITIVLKVNLKEIYMVDLEWDTPLEGELRDTWVRLLKSLVRIGTVKFARGTRPKGAVGRCILICFFDGSNCAFAAVVYARWEMSDGSVEVYLVTAKARVAPMFGTSTPRMELEGATLLARIVMRIVLAQIEDPPGQVFFLGDSETILASREKEGGFFGEFFGNRVGEILDHQERLEQILVVGAGGGEWYHVASEDNAADPATRVVKDPEDLDLGSEWLTGPNYLRLPVAEWPINRNFAERKKLKIPAGEVKRKYRSQVEDFDDLGCVGAKSAQVKVTEVPGGPGCVDNDVLKGFDYGRKTNSWEKLVQSTSCLFFWFAKVRNSDDIPVQLIAKDMAVDFWLRVAMPATNKAAVEGRLKHLSPMQHARYPDMLVVVGRAVKGLQQNFQKEYLPILMSKTRVAWLIMLWSHCLDHGGVDTTVQTSLQVAWVVGGRTLARSIKRSCVRCRYLTKQLAGQQMSVLPEFLAVPCPCFTYIAVDLAGPFLCKREGGARVTRRNSGTVKMWAVLLVCLQTKAVKIYIAGGLSTEDFLLAWDSFVADHGQPLIAYSDRGTNLTSAAREGGVHDNSQIGDDDLPAYDWDSIEGSTRGKTTWSFHPPGSQFRNGAVEVFVRKFKRTLEHKVSKRLMFMLELQTSFKIVASILNSRPIYARWGNRGLCDPDFLSALTPNMLLTGRVNSEVPVRDYVTSDKPLCRMKYVEECVAQWWHQFMAQNFSSLVPRQKWQFEKRNMCEGDVVLISYVGKCRPATYRLGVVVAVVVDDDHLVRTVTVEYSLLSELPVADRLAYKGVSKKRITVPVQRLCLILPVEEREGISSSGGQAGAASNQHDCVSEEKVDDQHDDAMGELGDDEHGDVRVESEHEPAQQVEDVAVGPGQSEHVPVQQLEDVAVGPVGPGGRCVQGGPDGQAVTEGAVVTGGTLVGGADGHGQQGIAGDVQRCDQQGKGVASKVGDFVRHSMKSCHNLDVKVTYQDYERKIYEAHSKEFDWEAFVN